MGRTRNLWFKKEKKHLILPASGQKHGFLDEDGAGQQDVPATPNVIGAEREESSSGYKVQGFRTLLKSEWNRREIKALLDLWQKQSFHQLHAIWAENVFENPVLAQDSEEWFLPVVFMSVCWDLTQWRRKDSSQCWAEITAFFYLFF